MIENLIKYINKVNIDDTEYININNNVVLKNDISKYSSSKEPSFKLEIDGLKVKRYDKVTYECPKCHIESTIGARCITYLSYLSFWSLLKLAELFYFHHPTLFFLHLSLI